MLCIYDPLFFSYVRDSPLLFRLLPPADRVLSLPDFLPSALHFRSAPPSPEVNHPSYPPPPSPGDELPILSAHFFPGGASDKKHSFAFRVSPPAVPDALSCRIPKQRNFLRGYRRRGRINLQGRHKLTYMKFFFSLLLSILLACCLFPGCAQTKAEKGRDAAPDLLDDGGTEKRIWLTFDDGPTDSTTPKILDILENENVKATFFVVGRQIAGREKILLREAGEGHAIGIHTYTHEYNKIYASADALRKDIDLCSKAIRSVLPDFNTDLRRVVQCKKGTRSGR